MEPVCAEAEGNEAECFALEVEPEKVEAEESLEGSGERGGFSPADLRSAYKLTTEAGEGKTIAIVDAYDDPNAEADLAVYRETYGLSPCTSANGCFKKVNQWGEQANYPTASIGWSEEISLDVDMASAVCPRCHILLVEAESNFFSSLGVAENEAAALTATTISNSWGGTEREQEVEEDKAFRHPGIPITVSSGDYGYGARYPASSPEVISVGGTALRKDPGTRGWDEDAWERAGSGCSLYETKPSWQKDSGCAKRFVADVSAVADPRTPVSVYDSYKVSGWLLFGGTSASAPIIAGVEALSSQTMREQGAQAFYNGTAGPLFDPTQGLNGYCTPPSEHAYFCHAQLGFDGPTGNGSPDMTPTATPLVASAATEVGVTGAKLVGTVNPRGSETKYRFEWGLTTSYGNSVPAGEGSAGSGNANVQISNSISGLESERTYHFRLAATNAKGTAYGEGHTLFTRGPNWAAEPTHLTNYGSAGAEPGKFAIPHSVAVSPVSGNVFVTDGEPNNRVQVFTLEGKFVRQFGSEGTEPGKFEDPHGITVDMHGHVWVTDWFNARVQEFSEEGAFLQAFGLTGVSSGHPAGIAVSASGNVWVTDPAEDVAVEYDEKGNYIRQFSTGNSPLGITIDEAGNIWTDNNNEKGNRIEEHSEAGVFIKGMAPNMAGQFRWGNAGQLSVDRYGNVWVTSYNSAAYFGHGPHEFFAEVLVYSSSGNLEEAFGSLGSGEEQLKNPSGLALDPRGYVWVADATHQRLSKWKIPALGSLTGATESGSGISAGGATLNGSVNPGGFNATYRFEYGKTTSYGKAVPSSGSTVYAGYNTTKVSQSIAGLEPHTTYHYRLVTSNFGATINGEDKTFTTERAFKPPTYSSSFGSTGKGNGQFENPFGIATDSEGNVWVSDITLNRVQKFNSKGEYQCQIGSKGSGNGQFSGPHGLAADAKGDVWVADAGNNRIEEIGPKCEYLAQLGKAGTGNGEFSFPEDVAIDPSGNIWVADSLNSRIQKLGPKGEFLAKCGSVGTGDGQFFEEVRSIEADADGNVWAGDAEGARMEKFGPKCEYLAKFDKSSSGSPATISPYWFAIDPSGNLWVGGFGFFPEGEFADHFTAPSGARGVAAGPDGSLWMIGSGGGWHVEKWSPGAPYQVQTGRAAQVKRTEATLTGKVNPEGKATSYRFEYGTTAVFGSSIPATPKSIGSGTEAVAVSQALDGLKADTTYYYHLVATTETGTIYGETRHFKTLAGAGVGAQVRIGGKTFSELGIKEATFGLSGSFKIVMGGVMPTFNCSEEGTGTLVSSGISHESVTLHCTVAGAETKCNVQPIWFEVNGSFSNGQKVLATIITKAGTGSCNVDEAIDLPTPTGSFEYGSEAVTLNVNSTATTTFGGNTVQLSGDSHWYLTGTNSGNTLAYW
ncbi:MAG TPA: hypothetical protein VFS64_10000 [Solirubrobacterales bacterium]|nr:hypothetical protein [Solirubrobacterales bacterium]